MFFIPMSIWIGHPSVTVGLYIWKGILPVLLGNILGGSLCCGAYHHLMYSWRAGVDGPASSVPQDDLEKGLSRQPSSIAGVVTEERSESDQQIAKEN